jgi:hypothetical protein
MKRDRSLRKRELVTWIFLSGSAAFVDSQTTKLEMNSEEPRRGLKVDTASGPPAEMEVKTSGAPFPNARRVTPAKDSEIPNLTVMYSSEGERYSSAVVDRHRISMNMMNRPQGKKITF